MSDAMDGDAGGSVPPLNGAPTGGHAGADAGPDASDSPDRSLVWVDADQRSWHIELTSQNITFRSGDDVIELPAAAWSRDIYIAGHGRNLIVRVETFESTVGFMVSREEAAPFISHVGERSTPQKPTPPPEKEAEPADRRVQWPRVSPLAVWALIASALVFIPGLGLVPAVATVILLVLHRVRVRRADAWYHSRALCTAAFVVLVAGFSVSALSTWSLMQFGAWIDADRLFAGPVAEGRNWGVVAAGIFVILLSLTVHEAAHAITAWWLGDGLARSLGRVTLNPIAHIDPIGTILLPLILVVMNGPVFGYARPVPVRVESLPRPRRAHILISLAGPGSNLLLAAVSLMVLLALGCVLRLCAPDATVANFSSLNFLVPVSASGFAFADVFSAIATILKLSFVVNIFLAIFNLIPIPPLDGSWVLEHLFPRSLGPIYARIRPFGFLIFLLAIYAGLFKYMLVPALMILVPAFLLLAGATGL